MNSTKLTTTAQKLRKTMDRQVLTRLGRDTGFTERLREVTPHRLAASLLSAFASQRIESIADILRAFNALTGASVRYKPFHNQLAKDKFPRFMEAVFQHLLKQTVVRVLETLPAGQLAGIDDILLHDGSSFAVDDGLREVFPGRFHKIAPAAVEVHTTMSVMQDQPIRISIAPDVQGEREFLPAPDALVGKLLLADRGYMDIDYCRRIQQAGGQFIVRFKTDVKPTVTRCWIKGRPRESWGGRTLKDCLADLRSKSADFDVRWERGGKVVVMRMVAIWNPETKDHMLLATNLPRAECDAGSVRTLYRLRWQVELLFKEWKSYANLHAFNTEKQPIAEGLMWAAFAAALLKRFLAHSVEVVFGNVRMSTRRTAMALAFHLPRLIESLLRGHGTVNRLRQLLEFLHDNGRRAHPKRDETRGRLRLGLRHAHEAAR